jgi:diketogulonate reductase-like aldo/keto reductase
MNREKMSRREATRLLGQAAASLLLAGAAQGAEETKEATMLKRAIPSSGESIPAIGLGTWQVFDVGSAPVEMQPLQEVLALFVRLGGSLVDSSPMYGRAEQVVGELAAKLGLQQKLFFATKVWTEGKQAGIESMERSLARLKGKRVDLMQIHNLLDLQTHLATLREWKEKGLTRYIGITHYVSTAYPEVAKLLRTETLDFLQINYSLLEREAEEVILPLARDRGVAVIVNRPFGGGDIFARVRGKPLPDWAAEIDCRSWAQFFLKWIVAHRAVTCTIPATNKIDHLEDNMQAGIGRLPDGNMRQRMVETIKAL